MRIAVLCYCYPPSPLLLRALPRAAPADALAWNRRSSAPTPPPPRKGEAALLRIAVGYAAAMVSSRVETLERERREGDQPAGGGGGRR